MRKASRFQYRPERKYLGASGSLTTSRITRGRCGSFPADGTLDPTVELRVQDARLAAEILSLRVILESVRKQAESIRVDVDRWTTRVERQAHTLPP